MRAVAHSDGIGPGGAEVVRDGFNDLRRDVSMSMIALEEGPSDVDVAAGPCGDPLFVVEEVVTILVVKHDRNAPSGTAIAGNSHRYPARGAICEAEVVDKRGIVEHAFR